MIDIFAAFSLGIVVGMTIIQFVNLFLKMREADKRWKEIEKDWRKDE